MDELFTRLRELLGPLTAEYRTGCQNYAAIGGFDHHFSGLVDDALRAAPAEHPAAGHLARIAALVADYRRLTPEERAPRLREVKRRLDALLECAPAPRAVQPTVPEPPPAPPRRGAQPARLEPLPPPPPPARPPEPPPVERAAARPTSELPRRGELTSEVQYLRGVGPQRARQLARLGIEQIGDVLFHFPRRHEDRSQILTLAEAQPEVLATFRGRVTSLEDYSPRRGGLRILKVHVFDGRGGLDLVWFNQPWLRDLIGQGDELIFTGRVQLDKYGHRQITQPAWEPFEEGGEAIHTGRLVPIYPLTEGVPQTTMRRMVKSALDQYVELVPEVLPAGVRERRGLCGRQAALRSFHFPESDDARLRARERLVYEEFYGLQVALAQRRHEYDTRGRGIAHQTDSALAAALRASLPFRFTAAQDRVLAEILRDLAAPRPMNRLVQGDVGSGKTLVALAAMLTVVDNGCQAALMVPTEILAEQHYRVIRNYCEPLGVRVDLFTGRAGSRERRERQDRLGDGTTQIAVGTHALIQEGIDFDRLGLVVVDEQHRFGVMQRKLLQAKGEIPDVLVMTATPIPRTLALTAYGDLDHSVIDELPAGRPPILTTWYPLGKRREVYSQIKQRLREGRQAYVVCPRIDEVDESEDIVAVTATYDHLVEQFKQFRVGLVHGRLKSAEKDAVMTQFRDGEVQILAATTVIEVGIDVPNATVMLILNADRFGLAQLHQLRGRIGRGAHESECYLLTDARYDPALAEDESTLQYRDARARLRFMVEYGDGFKLANADLELRGAGELGGVRQSGSMDLRVANLARDGRLLEQARDDARELIERDPLLASPSLAPLARYVAARFRERGQLAEVG
ncbi:MAG: ATP-dependent DNA helicase RecG [Fimbriimonadaceae bacterium]|nr:ATP-dependent DNA helicase RecG [Fimbriimonadaceae bacterium]